MDDFAEIQKLRRELTQAGYEYYVLDKPTMSDYDYDHMLRRLEELEAAEQGIDLLLAYGEQGRYYVEGAFGVDARWFETKDALCKALEQESIPGSVIWVKASRGMKLEEVLEQFYSRTSNP